MRRGATRRDKKGRLIVFKLRPDDGGGKFEVAGINERFHPEEAHHLAKLIEAGLHEEAERQALEIIATFTDTVSTWTTVTAVESYLRDSAFNRGARGAARILQRALKLNDDGVVGDVTRTAVAQQERDPLLLLKKMRAAREQYERDVAKRDESSPFWKGLVNRWDKALAFALTFVPDHKVEAATAELTLVPPDATFDAAEAAIAEMTRTTNTNAPRLAADTKDEDMTGLEGEEMAISEADIRRPQLEAATTAPVTLASPVLSPPSAPTVLPALRVGSQGDLVRAWQSFLLGQHLNPGEPDGFFGDKTAAATRAFRQQQQLEPDGIAGRQTILKAMQLGFELIEEPAGDTSGSNFPPRPNFPPLTGTAARQAVFGRFDFVSQPRPDNAENIRILGTWERDNIMTVPVPQLRSALGTDAPSGMRFHRLAADQLKGLWADWEAASLLDRILSFDGSFVPRFIRGSRTVLSNHAFGSAFDINAGENPLGARPKLVGQRGSVRELVQLANKWGFYWGGHFGSRLDGMHFEIAFIK